jgi:glycosyltransferase involved in cell wall biosynthesis
MFTPLPRLLSNDYDIIHGHTFRPVILTRLGKTPTDATTVFTVHGTAITLGVGRDMSRLDGVKRRIERQFVLRFDYEHVISVNNDHIGLLSEHHNDVSCIPNGVDLNRFSNDLERESDILFLGCLAPKKHVFDLIRASARVEAEFPETDLVIVRTDPREEDLAELAADMSGSDRVSFQGRVPYEAVTKHYATVGVFVLLSVWEVHPLTLLEVWVSGGR